jgi:hypothetical protein
MKLIIYVLLAAIVISLGTGLFYLRREDADSPKMLRALQVRVALSLDQPASLKDKGTVTLTHRVRATIPLNFWPKTARSVPELR